MFDIRVRLHTDQGTRGRVLQTQGVTWTTALSATCTLSFVVPRAVADGLQTEFLCGVEVSHGDAYTTPPRNLFIAQKTSGDNSDPAGTVKFDAVEFVPWLMARMYVRGFDATDGAVVRYPEPHSASWIATKLISQGKLLPNGQPGGGWGPNVTTDSGGVVDSWGQTWAPADWADIEWKVGTPLTSVIQQLADQGYMEWWTEGQLFRTQKAGTGRDLTDTVVVGGTGFGASPYSTTFEDTVTNLLISYGDKDTGTRYAHVPNAGASTRFGELWAVMTQSGVTEETAAVRGAQPVLADGRAAKHELSFEWTPTGLHPLRDFVLGDTVMARTRGGKLPRRVVGLVVSKPQKGAVTCRVVVGDKLATQAAKVASRAAAASMGKLISGSGDGVPAAILPGEAPATPTGVVWSSVGEWGPDGAHVTVTVTWAPVLSTVGGAAASVAEYEVWSRLPSEVSSRFTATDQTSIVTDQWPVGVGRLVKVRARSFGGVWSAFSTEIMVTPPVPATVIPKPPTGVSVVGSGSYGPSGMPVGSVVVSWAAVTQSTDNDPITVDTYEVWDGASDGVVLSTSLLSATFTGRVGGGVSYRVRAGREGVWSAWSATASATVPPPAHVTTPTTVPSLTSGMGFVAPVWDGNLTSGAVPNGFQHVVTETALSSTGPWSTVGVPATRAGQTTQIKGTQGATVWVRFRWADTLGRLSDPSAAASIVVVGVGVPDIDSVITAAITDAQNAATAAQSAADAAVISTVMQYALNTSEAVAPTSGWSTTYTAPNASQTAWMRTLVTYGDGSTQTTTAAAIPRGNPGATGAQGPQGVQGPAGADGTPRYTWLKYADTPTSGMSDSPTGKTYMGLAYNKLTATESSVYSDYMWSLIRGADGATGAQGPQGATGATGAQGVQGPAGANGQPTYTWIKYGTSAAGAGLSDDPTGKTYIGLAYNKLTATESNTPGDYVWSLIQGPQGNPGATGATGAQGPAGATGAAGISVTSVVRYYRLGTSAPTQPSGASPAGWSTTEPAFAAGQNLYAADRVAYSNSTYTWSPVVVSSSYAYAAAAQSAADTAIANAATAQTAADSAALKAKEALAAAVNVAPDPSFENNAEGWVASAGLNSPAFVSSPVRSGTKSAKPNPEIRMAFPFGPVKAGDVWRFSMFARASAAGKTFSFGVTRTVDTVNWVTPAHNPPIPVDVWTEFTVDWTVTQSYVDTYGTTAYARIATASSDVFFDDVSLVNVREAQAALQAANTAATAAATAQTAANNAQATANAAQTAAGNAATAAAQAQATASEKNRTYRNTTVATGTTTTTGDRWEQWTSLGTGGKLLAFWTWNGTSWIKGELDETYLPLVNIGSGTYGTLAGGRLTANTITARELLVTDMTNLWPNQRFDPTGPMMLATSGVTQNTPISTENPPTGGKAVILGGRDHRNDSYDFPVKASEPFIAEWVQKRTSGTAELRVGVWLTEKGPSNPYQTGATQQVEDLGNGWTRNRREFAVPADARRATLYFQIPQFAPWETEWLIADVTLRRRNAAELIVNGAITGRKVNATDIWADTAWLNTLRAGVIETQMVTPGFGDQLDIAANGSVTIIAGQLDEQGQLLAAKQSALDANVTATGLAATAASDANAAAAAAQAAANTAQNAADKLGLALVITNDDVRIQRPSAPVSLVMTNENISIRRNNVAQTWWDETQMVVPKLRSDQIVIGDTVITHSGPTGNKRVTWRQG